MLCPSGSNQSKATGYQKKHQTEKMTVEEESKAAEQRNVMVGIKMDNQSRELLSWALVKVAEPEDCVIAVHVCKSSGNASKGKPLLDSYLEVYDGLCAAKKVGLTGKISSGISVRKTLVREAKNFAAGAVVLGLNNQGGLRSWASTARYCSKRVPPTTEVLCIHIGKVVFRRCNSNQLPGLSGDPKPSLNLIERHLPIDVHSEFGDSEADTETPSYEILGTDHESVDIKNETSSLPEPEHRRRLSSLFAGDILDQRPGWPLLRRTNSAARRNLKDKKLSVAQWAMNLPDRSTLQRHQGARKGHTTEKERSNTLEDGNKLSSPASDQLGKHLERVLKGNSSVCKWFYYDELRKVTSNFHSDNLIGKGACNEVYKGNLPDCKPVAVRIQKSSEEAKKDFALEVEIISSLNHKNIAPLIGFCIDNSNLISIYDFFSRGSLEENLQGKNKKAHALSWDARYNIAVKIADALNHLHNECSRPVIHRDVKSSNILLSDGFEPQLSDFGLAIWGPTTSSFITHADAVGTFGYLAPEYFMYGKVSDKIDVYAFGVVLLELLSGRKPIGSETPKGQESLVMWARPILQSEDAERLLDPDLGGNLDDIQVNRMLMAAKLCITQAARIRPKMSEILKLLRGDENVVSWIKPHNKGPEASDNQDDNDDEVYPSSSAELHLSLALLDVDDNSTSFSSLEQGNNQYLEEYLKGRWSRSSSFD